MIAALLLPHLLRQHELGIDDKVLYVIVAVAMLEFVPKFSREVRAWHRRPASRQ